MIKAVTDQLRFKESEQRPHLSIEKCQKCAAKHVISWIFIATGKPATFSPLVQRGWRAHTSNLLLELKDYPHVEHLKFNYAQMHEEKEVIVLSDH